MSNPQAMARGDCDFHGRKSLRRLQTKTGCSRVKQLLAGLPPFTQERTLSRYIYFFFYLFIYIYMVYIYCIYIPHMYNRYTLALWFLAFQCFPQKFRPAAGTRCSLDSHPTRRLTQLGLVLILAYLISYANRIQTWHVCQIYSSPPGVSKIAGNEGRGDFTGPVHNPCPSHRRFVELEIPVVQLDYDTSGKRSGTPPSSPPSSLLLPINMMK